MYTICMGCGVEYMIPSSRGIDMGGEFCDQCYLIRMQSTTANIVTEYHKLVEDNFGYDYWDTESSQAWKKELDNVYESKKGSDNWDKLDYLKKETEVEKATRKKEIDDYFKNIIKSSKFIDEDNLFGVEKPHSKSKSKKKVEPTPIKEVDVPKTHKRVIEI